MSEFGNPGEAVTPAGPVSGAPNEPVASDAVDPSTAVEGSGAGGAAEVAGRVGAADDQDPASPVAVAMRELDTIGDRDLAEHPDVYQRIHTELQAALTTIDDA